MVNDQWTDRLSEYVDGELPDGDRIALEAHLQSCSSCREIVSDLRRVVRRARTLKDPAPRRDLWPGIASRIGATTAPARDIVDLESRRRTRRWAFSLPQLAAAGIALMMISGGTVWLLSPSNRPEVITQIVTVPSSEAPTIRVATRPNATQSYAAAVADLERILAQGRGRLDSSTVRVIEQNLAAIDQAIAEARRALDADSGNLYLNTHLAETMRRKLDLLRQAAALVPVS